MTRETMKSIGVRLHSFRKAKGLTLEKMAEKLGVTDKFLGSVERGERCMSADTLISLNKNYNCDLNYLLSGVEETGDTPYRVLLNQLGEEKSQYLYDIILSILNIYEQ